MANCTSLAISDCKRIKGLINCIPTLIQGENKDLNIQLINNDNTCFDLNTIDEIHIIVYDDRNEVVGDFRYPFESSYNEILFLQENYTGDYIENCGVISIKIDKSITMNSIAGNLYAEIKISNMVDTFGSNDMYIPCFLIGKIKSSKMNMYLKEPDDIEENRII